MLHSGLQNVIEKTTNQNIHLLLLLLPCIGRHGHDNCRHGSIALAIAIHLLDSGMGCIRKTKLLKFNRPTVSKWKMNLSATPTSTTIPPQACASGVQPPQEPDPGSSRPWGCRCCTPSGSGRDPAGRCLPSWQTSRGRGTGGRGPFRSRQAIWGHLPSRQTPGWWQTKEREMI